MIEEWRPVVGWEGLYEVSSFGKVKKINGTFLKEYTTFDGYLEVILYSKETKVCKYARVHRVVAEAYLTTWNPDLEVNHKDGIKSNNCVDNLEMVTHQENMDHYWHSDVFAEHQAEYLKYARKVMSDRWKDPEFRNKVQSRFDDPEYKKAHSLSGKRVYSDPEQRKRASIHAKEMWAKDGFHDKQVAAIKKGWSDPDKRKAASNRLTGLVWLTAPDGRYYRCPPEELDSKLAEGYVKGRIGDNRIGGTKSVYCKKNGKLYCSMTQCEKDLGLKPGDVHHILAGTTPKRLIPVQKDLQLSLISN